MSHHFKLLFHWIASKFNEQLRSYAKIYFLCRTFHLNVSIISRVRNDLRIVGCTINKQDRKQQATRNQLVYIFTRPKFKQPLHCHFCHARPLGSRSVLIQVLYRGEIGTKFLDGVKVACFKIYCLQRHLYTKFLASIFL